MKTPSPSIFPRLFPRLNRRTDKKIWRFPGKPPGKPCTEIPVPRLPHRHELGEDFPAATEKLVGSSNGPTRVRTVLLKNFSGPLACPDGAVHSLLKEKRGQGILPRSTHETNMGGLITQSPASQARGGIAGIAGGRGNKCVLSERSHNVVPCSLVLV